MSKFIECGECLELIATNGSPPGEIVTCKNCGVESIIPENDEIRGKIAKSSINTKIYGERKTREEKQNEANKLRPFLIILFNGFIINFYLMSRCNLYSTDFLKPLLGESGILLPIIAIPFFVYFFVMAIIMYDRILHISNKNFLLWSHDYGEFYSHIFKSGYRVTWKYAVYFIITFELFFWINWSIEKLF